MRSDLEVGSSGYYKWKSKPICKSTLLKSQIKQQITPVYFASKQRYGSPSIAIELNASGCKVSRIMVAKYMREFGLRSKLSKKFKLTTDSTQLSSGRKCIGEKLYSCASIKSLGIRHLYPNQRRIFILDNHY